MASDRTRPGMEVKSESPGPRPTGPVKSRSARAREGRAARPITFSAVVGLSTQLQLLQLLQLLLTKLPVYIVF